MQTVLVIDDDESLRDTIGVLLEQEGLRPVLVADGRDGFEKALFLKPELILVDLRLPGMTGIDICKNCAPRRCRPPSSCSALSVTRSTKLFSSRSALTTMW